MNAYSQGFALPGMPIIRYRKRLVCKCYFCRRMGGSLYAESVEAQPVDTAMALHHAELVELLFARGRATADVPLLSSHDFVKTLCGAI